MEGRPPDDDELFEWTDPPPRPPRAREGADTAERARVERASPARPEPGPSRPARGDTGEFERSGRRPPPGRRARRRDLPAKVRRRQDFGIGAAAVALVILLIVLVSSGGGGSSEPASASVPLKRLIGQTIVAKVGKGGPSQDLVKRVRQGQVGGVIVLPGSAQSLKAEVLQLQQAAIAGQNRPLLVMVDQEGGDVKRLPGPPDIPPQQLGRNGDEGAAKDQGQKTGSYLKSVGVNVDLAPVLDVAQPQTAGTIKSRTFGSDPAVVSKVGVAFATGLQDGGTAATAKHFPGLGRATVSTDDRPVTIAATSEQLQSDLEPFQAAVDAGVDMVMLSTASYPTLGSKQPAAFSPAIVRGLLRDRLGFDGVAITDDLESPAVTGVTTPSLAASSALVAGDDLLLFAQSDSAANRAFGSLVSQVKRGDLNRAVIQNAYDRIASLKDKLQ